VSAGQTKPTVKASVGAGQCTKSSVKVNVSSSNLKSKTAKLGGKSIGWPKNNTFTAEGKYTIAVVSKAGSKSTFTFIIDHTAPKISVTNLAGKSIKKNGSSKKAVKVSYSDANFSSRSLKRQGKSIAWPKGNKVTKKGTYVVTIVDKAGYRSSFMFKIV
jgi:hypothetical protein